MAKPFDVNRAIAAHERAEHLADAETNAAWVIHVPRIKRVKSRSDSCIHDVSYTMPCTKCRRSKQECEAHRERIRLLIQQNQ